MSESMGKINVSHYYYRLSEPRKDTNTKNSYGKQKEAIKFKTKSECRKVKQNLIQGKNSPLCLRSNKHSELQPSCFKAIARKFSTIPSIIKLIKPLEIRSRSPQFKKPLLPKNNQLQMHSNYSKQISSPHLKQDFKQAYSNHFKQIRGNRSKQIFSNYSKQICLSRSKKSSLQNKKQIKLPPFLQPAQKRLATVQYHQRKENYINTQHNIRKQRLQQITQENRKLYDRINSQKSVYDSQEFRRNEKQRQSISRNLSLSRQSNRKSQRSLSNSRASLKSVKRSGNCPSSRRKKVLKAKIESHSIEKIRPEEINQFSSIFSKKSPCSPQRKQPYWEPSGPSIKSLPKQSLLHRISEEMFQTREI